MKAKKYAAAVVSTSGRARSKRKVLSLQMLPRARARKKVCDQRGGGGVREQRRHRHGVGWEKSAVARYYQLAHGTGHGTRNLTYTDLIDPISVKNAPPPHQVITTPAQALRKPQADKRRDVRRAATDMTQHHALMTHADEQEASKSLSHAHPMQHSTRPQHVEPSHQPLLSAWVWAGRQSGERGGAAPDRLHLCQHRSPLT